MYILKRFRTKVDDVLLLAEVMCVVLYLQTSSIQLQFGFYLRLLHKFDRNDVPLKSYLKIGLD